MNDIEVLEDCLKNNQEMLDGQVFGDEMEKSTKLEQQALRNSITAMKENAKLRQDVDGLEGNCRWLKNKNKKLEAEKDKKIERLEKMLKAQGEESAKLSKDYYTLKQVSIYELALEIEATPASDNLDMEDYEAISEAIINKYSVHERNE